MDDYVDNYDDYYYEDYDYHDERYSDISRRKSDLLSNLLTTDFQASKPVPYYESLETDNNQDLSASGSERNQRLNFVHYVYPKKSSAHFKHFEDKNYEH